jgi:peptidoglycan/xylan/chitin deacetylase (PgdA/CDA1 family)
MPRGALCISIDLELGWGIWDRPSADYFDRCAERETAIVDGMLALFAKHDVAATWAVVGRLLDRTDAPPARTAHGDRIWYAPALIDAIRAATPAQDIGSHGYAHLYFREAARDALEADLAAVRRIHDEHAIDLVSFVFPRNQVDHVDLLVAAGVRVFRSVDVGWHTAVRDRLGRIPGRIANLGDKIVPIAPAAVVPVVHAGGIVELPSSMLLMSRNGLRRLVHPEIAVIKARRGLAAARRDGGVFHLWFHPSNFYYETETQLGVLDRILTAAAAMRDRGELDIKPMRGYAA